MTDKDSSLSIDQCIDAFKQQLGSVLHSILELSDDTLPTGLPTPVKPGVPVPAKRTNDEKPVKSS